MIPESKWVRSAFFVTLSVLVGVVLFIVWASVDKATGMTSGAEFCGSCHSMKLVSHTYYEDKHSSVAVCTDCHLPQDSFLNHYLHKAQHGIRDVIKEHIVGVEDKDWIGNLSNSEQFVYKSGCLKCHDFKESDKQKFDSHKLFLADENLHCVTCHRVGHKNLREHLSSSQ